MENLRAQAMNQENSTDPPERVEGLLNINVLPERYQPRRVAFTTVLAWLIFVALVGLLYLSTQRFQQGTQALAEQRVRFAAAQEALQAAEVQPAEIEALQNEISALQEQAGELAEAVELVNIQRVQWGSQLAGIVLAAPDGLRLNTISQEGEQVTLSGMAEQYGLPLAYRDSLMDNPDLSNVVLLSIARIEADELEIEAAVEPTPTETEEGEAEAAATPVEFFYQFTIRLEVPAAVEEVSE